MRFNKISCAALAASVVSAQNATNTTTASNSTSTALPQQLSGFYGLLQSYGLSSSLSNLSNVTVLAPNNDAVSILMALGIPITAGFVNALVNYHTLNGTISAADISNSSVAFPHTHLTNPAYSHVTGGQVVEVIDNNGTVTFFSGLKNNVTVTDADINFSGGLIHVIDNFLTIPQNFTSTAVNANLTALVGAAQELNLTSTLNSRRDLTIFAPDNMAFQSISGVLANASLSDLQSILGYHVVSGAVLYSADITNTTVQTLGGGNLTIQNFNGTYFVNNAEVINPDILFSGGVIHVIDSVLNPNNTVPHNATTGSSSSKKGSSSTITNAYNIVATLNPVVPFTSGVATPTSTNAAQGSATTGALSTSSGAAAALKTGAVGAAALFGGAAAMMANF